jgi:hypothetical protein
VALPILEAIDSRMKANLYCPSKTLATLVGAPQCPP